MNKHIRLNDVKAPRFNDRKFRKNILCKESWKKWKLKTGKNIPFTEFRRIWIKIADGIRYSIVNERDGVRLRGLGDFYIGYVRTKAKPIDYKLSKEYGKVILHENWHTDGKVAKLIWGVYGRRYVIRRRSWWGFINCRSFKHQIVQAIKDNPDIYKNSQEKRSVEKNIPEQELTEQNYQDEFD